ncbi:fumarylacetoacetate hydrolase family protein [Puniceibacterium sp. IMCC21224]|uniref:fumarylacetoacetate hydrolase family protein n=1 Tax=Puniceibacterium sp. IMCC21224 TaxID=1618204 RepID=UPI00064DBA19|nr:fumarylacetoacetate hydrolase family protein [Puniceibacterium sp. IMCC21224]KMK68001.1 2-keto-4-pentenoate hydratase/2-oxohepta-3-ene-1,7-dioic acid hydratase [Puniceibacterium sp. IMCC21224]
MKIATLRIPVDRVSNTGTPDGQLVVVSDDLTGIEGMAAQSLQEWLDKGFGNVTRNHSLSFPDSGVHSPLPRAYQFLDGSAYVNHVELVRQARGAQMPDSFWHDPLMYQGGSDSFLAPTDDIVGDPDWGIDFEGEIAVITGFVPMGASREQAAEAIRFVMLCNDVSLRNLIPGELAKGFGFVQSKPACSFSPVAVTPDALPGWDGAKLHGVLRIDLNGEPFGRVDAGTDMTFDFPTLIAHAARTRNLAPGTIVGSGTVSNKLDGGPGKPVAQGGAGYACIAEQRMIETILTGAPTTPFLRPGDHVKIWMEDDNGASIFGAISQTVRHIKDKT